MEASVLHAPVPTIRTSSRAQARLRSDEQLVALFRSGDEEAFRAIHDRYRQRLLAYARQMLAGSRADAEDALQDVFVRAYRALRADGRPVSLRAWLMGGPAGRGPTERAAALATTVPAVKALLVRARVNLASRRRLAAVSPGHGLLAKLLGLGGGAAAGSSAAAGGGAIAGGGLVA